MSSLPLLLLLLASCGRTDPTPPTVLGDWSGTGGTSLLVDSTHAQDLAPLLSRLGARDFRHRQLLSGSLGPQALSGHDVVLVDAPRPLPEGKRLDDAEVASLVDHVESGGGLLVVAVPGQATTLDPLLSRFGVQAQRARALEEPWSDASFDARGRSVILSRYAEHPVTDQVRATSWLQSAPLVTEHGLAFLSDAGRVDPLGDEPAFDSPGAPVAAAVEHGQGRVVVLGDHDLLGTTWLGVADNHRLAENAFAWLAGREGEEPPTVEPLLGVELTHSEWNIGARTRWGYSSAFHFLAAGPDHLPAGLLDVSDPAEVLLLLDPRHGFTGDELARLDARLAAGRRIVLVMDPTEPKAGSLDVLATYLPELVLRLPHRDVVVRELLPGKRTHFHRAEGSALPATSATLGLADLPLGALKPPRFKGHGKSRTPHDVSEGTPYLLDFRIETGVPLVSATTTDGREITVAQRFAVGGGELILVPQGRLWSNETFGVGAHQPDHEAAIGALELQRALVRWLATRPPILGPAEPSEG